MRDRTSDVAGFSLIEVVIAMFLLGLIAVALLPALIQGIRLSTEQSSVATATRQLNSLIEDARQQPSCSTIATAIAEKSGFVDGSGRAFTTKGSLTSACAAGSAVSISITATQDARKLATVDAIIYVPAAS